MAELVFVHGAGDSAAVWQCQVDHFSRRHRVLAIDLPGRGARLAEPALESLEQSADEVARLVREAGFSRPVVAGHSMGGGVALTLALRHPDLPRALVLVGSGARLRIHPDILELARQRAEAAPDEPAGAWVSREWLVSPRAADETLAWIRQRAARSTRRATHADFRATDAFDAMARLAEITLPVLVLGGEDDRLTPPKYQRFLEARLPHAHLVLLPEAGHYVQVEQAAAVNEAIDGFLATIPHVS